MKIFLLNKNHNTGAMVNLDYTLCYWCTINIFIQSILIEPLSKQARVLLKLDDWQIPYHKGNFNSTYFKFIFDNSTSYIIIIHLTSLPRYSLCEPRFPSGTIHCTDVKVYIYGIFYFRDIATDRIISSPWISYLFKNFK